MPRLENPDALARLRGQLIVKRGSVPQRISVCGGTGCRAAKASGTIDALKKEIARRRLGDEVELRQTGCYGFCEQGPVVVADPRGYCYLGVKASDAAEIVDKTIVNGKPVERLFYKDAGGVAAPTLEDIPFYRTQKRVLLDGNTQVDPRSIDDYIAAGGYAALSRVLSQMKPEEVIDVVKRSGLRGRGGGGFPTGVKWETTRNAPGDTKYVLVNADEGDPGAYMDRSLLEGNPHAILEGLVIGAFAIGAKQGFVYVRQEYPLAVENTLRAIEQARAYGLLGNDILGTGFSFDVELHRGAGAFVSGESSALMTAIEGRVGQPRPKYVHTSVSGLWDRPSNLNNVETWANIPIIVNKGADWFHAIGTQGSSGTKVFSLVGKVKNTGLVEVPMGMTLRQIIYDIGGGIPNGKRFKAVQTGGPSGGFLPESALDLPVDFDELWKAGSMMGSGGMIVMDEDSCMVDAARFYVRFLAHESCGQCLPCREGLRQMQHTMDRIALGDGREGDVELLEEICDMLGATALCALGTSAPFPVRSAIQHFRSEFDAHIREKRCPSLVCMDLIHYQIDEKCNGCSLCRKSCPADAIVGVHKQRHEIDQAACVKCGNCVSVCPPKVHAISKVQGGAKPAAPLRIPVRKAV
jgi:NADH:ubiquinone oxidoreductase subunit F (NADH-binding)/(2Fe-2S) ferredoxin/Pyruvate/2-oxoacid:ferredoxin oxidoreductase delta subunit